MQLDVGTGQRDFGPTSGETPDRPDAKARDPVREASAAPEESADIMSRPRTLERPFLVKFDASLIAGVERERALTANPRTGKPPARAQTIRTLVKEALGVRAATRGEPLRSLILATATASDAESRTDDKIQPEAATEVVHWPQTKRFSLAELGVLPEQ